MVPNNSEKPANSNVTFFNRWSEQRASYLLNWFDGLWTKSWVAFLALRPVTTLSDTVVKLSVVSVTDVWPSRVMTFINLQISQIRQIMQACIDIWRFCCTSLSCSRCEVFRTIKMKKKNKQTNKQTNKQANKQTNKKKNRISYCNL